MDLPGAISEHLQNGEAEEVARLTRQAITAGMHPKTILDDCLIRGMSVVGEKFRAREIFLPDVLLAAKAMYAGIDLLKPLLIEQKVKTLGKIVIGTVQGDLHDIGKNLVAIMLRGAGFEVVDLGNDVSPERFITTAEQEKADVIGMSALLTTTMPVMKSVVGLARARQLYGKVKIVVGGAPLSHDYAREIGADAYCFDGMNAVECIKRFVTH